MMDALDMQRQIEDTRRENAVDCDECRRRFGDGSNGTVRKARGIVCKDYRETAVCIGCGEMLFGDENLDGEPIADDHTLRERAEQAQLARYAESLS